MTASTPFVRSLLVASPFCAVAALALGGIALWRTDRYDASGAGVTKWIFETAAHLAFEPPKDDESLTGWTFSLARLFVVLWGFTTGLGVLFALSRTANDAWLRMTFWFGRTFLDKRPSIVVGLGAVLTPLLSDLRKRRPVYAIDPRIDGPGVREARERGVLVVTGDATEASVRRRVNLVNASEVFIATGEDLRNLDIAARFLDTAAGLRDKARRDTLKIYVHSGDPTRFGTIEGYGLLRDRVPGVDVVIFNFSDLAARDLFFAPEHGLAVHHDTVPRSGEVFHLFVLGFGPTGQAVSLHVSRFAHFASRLRPRLTIYLDSDGTGEQSARQFLESHPAFAPADLDLSSKQFLETGDGWDVRPARPIWNDYRRPAQEDLAEIGTTRRVRPVEYAVNAEFRSLPTRLEADYFLREFACRISPSTGPRVRSAAVVCFEHEGRNFRAALRLREALARHFLDDCPAEDAAPDSSPILPIYVYLPTDHGLARAVADHHKMKQDSRVERAFPLRPFGRPKDVTSYDAITRGPFLGAAAGIRRSYEILSGRNARAHPDFDDSNLDAALHAERIKLPAIGALFAETLHGEAAAAGQPTDHRLPLLAELSRPDVVQAAEDLLNSKAVAKEDGRLVLSIQDLQRVPPLVRRHLAILDRIHVPAADRREREEDRISRSRLEEAVRNHVGEVIRELERDLRAHGRDLDTVAEMEHNRWMGERLAKGWSYGPRSEVRCQRRGFVPWEDLSEFDRDIDRAQLARLIVGQSANRKYAFVTSGDD